MARVDCPFCGTLGMVSAERIIHADGALTTYYCDACHTEWDEREGDSRPLMRRSRPPKTHRDKTS